MTTRVCVINGKGGCGKTTVATHLAAGLAVSGLNTLLVDLDRHRGASRWHKIRPKSAASVALTDWRKGFGSVPKGVQRVVIDCPASLRQPQVRDIVAESDLLVVPLLPSIFDQHATKLFLQRLHKIKKVRSGRKEVLIVHNRCRERSTASRQLDAYLADLGHAPFARIADRTLYPQLAARGLTVFDGTSQATRALQEEWMPLIEEIEAVSRPA
ncbi:MAG: ParA family protein [Alphaproteobacteria bacterium]|nr:ParA family protein [Alphaproteobacteria bacterium]MCB9929512.1 ParA family protein [Alphaproteobacteria bacterium]